MTAHKAKLEDRRRNPLITDLRRRKGWSLQQLADAMGVSKTHACNVELGNKELSPKLVGILLAKGHVDRATVEKMVQKYVRDEVFRLGKGK
ncbi:MAG TPA: helix-turn-helix transcriptional regulator [bacterium]|nr:helix-turn-helix transcriptional regulator [bacterium]